MAACHRRSHSVFVVLENETPNPVGSNASLATRLSGPTYTPKHQAYSCLMSPRVVAPVSYVIPLPPESPRRSPSGPCNQEPLPRVDSALRSTDDAWHRHGLSSTDNIKRALTRRHEDFSAQPYFFSVSSASKISSSRIWYFADLRAGIFFWNFVAVSDSRHPDSWLGPSILTMKSISPNVLSLVSNMRKYPQINVNVARPAQKNACLSVSVR